jgi:hypothetical protein
MVRWFAIVVSIAGAGCATPCLNRALPVSHPGDGVVVMDAEFGFVADRVCSREHCWSNTSVVWHDASVHPPRIYGSADISELSLGALVHSACWVPKKKGGFFRARVSPRQEPGTSYVARVTPLEKPEYQIVRESP